MARLADLVDDIVGPYVEWRLEAAAVAHAYRRWCEAPPGEERRWFSAYVAALDREHAAAAGFERAVGNTTVVAGGP